MVLLAYTDIHARIRLWRLVDWRRAAADEARVTQIKKHTMKRNAPIVPSTAFTEHSVDAALSWRQSDEQEEERDIGEG